jgi:ribosomal-protein-alanine N-acetyltransferase
MPRARRGLTNPMSSAPPRTQPPVLAELPRVMESPRLRLRDLDERDAEAYFPMTADPVVSQHLTWAPHKSIDETREWLRMAAGWIAEGTDIAWAIEHEGAPVGCIGLHGITWSVAAVKHDNAALGYWLGPAHWGKGLMTEAVALVLRWGFETLGLHKINVSCVDENPGSRRVIEKSGFRFLCRAEEDVWREGRWFGHLRYELLASEWADSTRTLQFRRS